MDSDRFSSASPTGKICSCQCERRMRSFKYDFHTVCIPYRGLTVTLILNVQSVLT